MGNDDIIKKEEEITRTNIIDVLQNLKDLKLRMIEYNGTRLHNVNANIVNLSFDKVSDDELKKVLKEIRTILLYQGNSMDGQTSEIKTIMSKLFIECIDSVMIILQIRESQMLMYRNRLENIDKKITSIEHTSNLQTKTIEKIETKFGYLEQEAKKDAKSIRMLGIGGILIFLFFLMYSNNADAVNALVDVLFKVFSNNPELQQAVKETVQ